MKIVIIEDEPMMAMDLASDIQSLRPDWQVIKTLGSVKQAREWLAANGGFDLIFSDIQLGDGNCFDVFSKLAPPAPVIFCTAYDQFALQAFQANGIGYLLKPYSRDHLRAAIEKFERLRPSAPDLSALFAQLQSPKPAALPPHRILVHHKDKIIPVPFDDIALFYLHHEQTMLLRFDGQRFALPEKLSEIEEMVGAQYYRASRQHLVSRKAIREATQYFARKLLLTLTVPFEEEVTISKEKVGGFLEWLA